VPPPNPPWTPRHVSGRYGCRRDRNRGYVLRTIRTAKEQKSVSLERRAQATTRNTVAKKRAGVEDVDSAYLFGDFLRLPGFRSVGEMNLKRRVGSIYIQQLALLGLLAFQFDVGFYTPKRNTLTGKWNPPPLTRGRALSNHHHLAVLRARAAMVLLRIESWSCCFVICVAPLRLVEAPR
jgi:hypothetical protein